MIMRTRRFRSGSTALLLTIAALPSLSQTRPHAAFVEGSEYVSQAGRSQMTLHLNSSVRYKSGRLRNPDRLYIDMLDVSTGPKWATPSVSPGDTFVRQIRAGHPVPNTTRVVVDLKLPADVSLVELKNPPRLLLILRPEEAAAPREPEPPAVPPRETSAAGPVTGPEPAPPPIPPSTRSVPLPQVSSLPSMAPAPVASLVSPGVPSSAPSLLAAAPAEPIVAIRPSGAPPGAVVEPAPSPGPVESARKLKIPRVTRPPKLADFLDRTPREAEAVVSDFRQRTPGDGTPISQQTSAYLSYDDANLYVVFVCKDEPGKVRAQMSKREDTSDDDSVGIYLDSFHDRQHAYFFSVNPFGIQSDGLIADGDTSPDYSFDTLWQSEGRLTRDGYVVWMAIPFKSLRFSHDENQTWGVALARSMLRTGETAFWPYITNRKASFLDQFGDLEGFDSVSPSRNLQLIPYVTGAGARVANPGGPGYQSQQDFRAGLDGKVVLRNALTLDFTVNPDFSQVESDDPQVTVNKRYEVYFPEKRPFFIEDAGYFSTPIDLFFSRQVVDPEFGARLTGRIGRWSIGALAIDDRAPGKLLDPGAPLYGDHAVIGVTRVQRDFGSQSQAGVMLTSRTFGSDSNRVVSFDTRLKLSPTWFFTGQMVRTFDRESGAAQKSEELQGQGYSANLSHNDRHLSYSGTYLDLSPDFNSQLGFIPRVDIRDGKNYLGYFWRPEGKAILDYGLSETVTSIWNHQNQLQDLNSYLQFQMDFTGRTGVTVTRYDAYEFYLNRGFQYGTTGASFYANWLKWLYLSGSYTQGNGVNYYPASGVAPFLGSSQNASFGFKLRPKPRIRIEQNYYYSRLGTRSGFEVSGAQPTVFDDYLSRTKLNYQFTTALSLRGILDYDALLSNVSLFGQQTSKQLTGDVLLTYLLNPGTAVYLGYDSGYANLSVDPTAPPMLFRFGPPTYLTGRQIFVKLTYRLRF